MFDTSIAKKCRYFLPANQGIDTEGECKLNCVKLQ